MRLSCFDLCVDILFAENRINVLILEKPEIFTEFLERILRQCGGTESGLLLSEDDKKLSFDKHVTIVHSPMLLELNSKRIQNYLFQEMKSISDDFLFKEKESINSAIVNYLDNIEKRLPYPIRFDVELDAAALFKCYEVQLDFEPLSLLEKLLNYLQLEKMLCKTKLVILVNIKAYLEQSQIEELYKFAFYNKIQILLLESEEKGCLPNEKYYIIDKDRCLIVHE